MSPQLQGSCTDQFEDWSEGSEFCYQKIKEAKNWYDAKYESQIEKLEAVVFRYRNTYPEHNLEELISKERLPDNKLVRDTILTELEEVSNHDKLT